MFVGGLQNSIQTEMAAGTGHRQLAGLRRLADEVGDGSPDALRSRVQELVGNAFFGLVIKEMRKTLSGSEYFHGGRGEEIFMCQFDMEIADRMSATLPASFIDPMVEQLKWRLGLPRAAPGTTASDQDRGLSETVSPSSGSQ